MPRLVGEGRPSDREGSTWGGRVTVRRIDGEPVEPAIKTTVAPLAAASERQLCPACGKIATPEQYIDRVRIDDQMVLRHGLCRPIEVAASGALRCKRWLFERHRSNPAADKINGAPGLAYVRARAAQHVTAELEA